MRKAEEVCLEHLCQQAVKTQQEKVTKSNVQREHAQDAAIPTSASLVDRLTERANVDAAL
jgi:hypothetical protein